MKRERIAVAAMLVLAGLLRLWGLEQMEFKYDEFKSIDLGWELLKARPWATAAEWPSVGLRSSGGIDNPPFYNSLIALFWTITHSPIGCTACVALINVFALLPIHRWARRLLGPSRALIVLGWIALSPFAVIHSRKLWPPELLLPGVALLLWGLTYWAMGRLWLAAGLLAWAALFFSQLHLSGPVFLVIILVLLLVDVAKRICEGRRLSLGLQRWWEACLVISGVTITVCYVVPYLRYLATLSPESFRRGMRLAWPEPQLLYGLVTTVVPMDLEAHFKEHWSMFVAAPSLRFDMATLRWVAWTGTVYTAIVLSLRGAADWVRNPSAIPLVGAAWLGFILLFSFLRLPAYAQYALVLYPLPALLIAGAFEPVRRTGRGERLWHWLRWVHLALLGLLSFTTVVWVTGRGGAAGDYGVGFGIRMQQAKDVIDSLHYDALNQGPLQASRHASMRGSMRHCGSPSEEVEWLVGWLSPQHRSRVRQVRICEGWRNSGVGDAEFQWELEPEGRLQ